VSPNEYSGVSQASSPESGWSSSSSTSEETKFNSFTKKDPLKNDKSVGIQTEINGKCLSHVIQKRMHIKLH